MRLWPRNRKRKTFPATMQKLRTTEKRIEKEGRSKKHENGDPTRRSEIN
jgi:hypothetical protein